MSNLSLRIADRCLLLFTGQAETAAVAHHGAEDSEDDAAVDETKDGIVAARVKSPVSVLAPVARTGLIHEPETTPAARLSTAAAGSPCKVGSDSATMADSSLLVPFQRECEPELMPELEMDQTCTGNETDEDSDSDDEQFEDVYSPVLGDKADDWGVTAIIKQQPTATDDAEEWAATATVPLRTISAARALADGSGAPDTADAMAPAPAPSLYDSSDDVSIRIP